MKSLITLATVACLSLSSLAQNTLSVQDAWVRATVPGQMATGAFMRIQSGQPVKLAAAQSPAGLAQIHQMRMDQGVMRMSEVQGGLDITSSQALELKPGGYHIMLMDLKEPLKAGSTVELTLLYLDASKQQRSQTVQVPVRTSPPHGGAQPHQQGHAPKH